MTTPTTSPAAILPRVIAEEFVTVDGYDYFLLHGELCARPENSDDESELFMASNWIESITNNTEWGR